MTVTTAHDLFTHAETLKRDGIKKIEEARPADSALLREAIEQVASTGRTFSSDDVREYLAERGITLSHQNSLGAAFNAMARSGAIASHGYVRTHTPSTHSHVVKVWRKA